MSDRELLPEIIVFAGPNGSGKSTITRMSKTVGLYINADDISDIKEIVFTQDDMDELARLEERPITFDEDCPEVTTEQAIRFHRVNPVKKS